ncbi:MULTISPECIES: hypothetical protein [unclassified Rhizobium]|uniref:hypothetical protein n=1 Tax=unclassified Rhizobium TaxID=2613769 RepID=UPI00247ACDCF|nr:MULTISPECIES: hypothetical protein [unclassified Rhizobium]MDH7801292.1 DNA gyrase/topoisomerase IV subunit B [Rhizobium sp. AN70]
MTDNAIAPLSQVQENIRNKIKAEFVNLIPDEMWSAMVASVVEDFTSNVEERYGRMEKRESPMKRMIREEIEAQVKASIKAKIDALGQSTWDGLGERIMSDAMNKLIAEHFETVLASVNAGMTSMMINAAINNLRQSMMR